MGAMDRRLLECFLQAARTRLKDKDLPIAGNQLYANHLRPCRRAGTSLDVKLSSFKKLVKFLEHLQHEDLVSIKVDAKSGDVKVTSIVRNNQDLREFQPWPAEEEADFAGAIGGAAASGASGAAVGGGVDFAASVVMEPVWKLHPASVWAPVFQACSGALETPEHASVDEVAAALKAYADAKELWQKSNRKKAALDGALRAILASGGASIEDFESGLPVPALAEKALERAGRPCHRATVPQRGAAGGNKVTIRPGHMPEVAVRTEQRRGHNVTLILGLEAYGVDLDRFAEAMKRTVASSTGVEPVAEGSTLHAVMVQGFWDQAAMAKVVDAGIPKTAVKDYAKKGQVQKKEKQGTNVVKH